MFVDDSDYDTWFDEVMTKLSMDHDIEFADYDACKMDFEEGKSVDEVVQEIVDEYSE